MIEPTGYTALDLIGFTDRGTYAANVHYVKNDLVHYGGSIWKILIDDTIGITPAEGPNYTIFMGESSNIVERIIAPLEDNPATVAYQTGRQIIYNDYLYEVIDDIAVGDTLITYEDDPTNANIKLAAPVETQVLALDTRLTASEGQINNLASALTVTGQRITDIEIELNKLKTLKGKTIIVLGDSLTEGSLNSYHNTWVEMLATKYECTTYNYGLSGSPIASSNSDSMISRLPSILQDHNTCDVFILSGGANDKNRSIPLGSSNSDNNGQVIGAVKNIFKSVRSKYGENCLLLGMTTYHRYQDSYNAPAADTAPNALGLREYDYVDAVMRACNALSIPCFNNYDNCGISLATQEVGGSYNAWCDSGIEAGQGRSYHLSVKAYEYLTPIYAQFIANGYTNCGAVPSVYETINSVLWSKTKLNNGLALVTGRFHIVPTWTTLGDHIAIYNPNAFTIPKGYQLTDILSANVSLRNDKNCTFGTISGLTNTSSGSSLTMRFVNIFGSSTTSVDIYAFVSIIGFDNGI